MNFLQFSSTHSVDNARKKKSPTPGQAADNIDN
jgi:hypothetical protein